VLRPGGYLIYVHLTFPHWLSRAGRLLGPLMSFPSIKGFESFAAREGLTKIHQRRHGIHLRGHLSQARGATTDRCSDCREFCPANAIRNRSARPVVSTSAKNLQLRLDGPGSYG